MDDHQTSAATQTTDYAAGKYLIFALGEEEYGLEVLAVREIVSLLPLTSVPRTPDYVKGVMNLRGKVIPVIDLRAKFGLPAAASDRQTAIVVVEIQDSLAGVLVDRVREVADVPAEDVEDVPDFGGSLDVRFVNGLGKFDGRVLILLNIEKVLHTDGLAAIHAVAN